MKIAVKNLLLTAKALTTALILSIFTSAPYVRALVPENLKGTLSILKPKFQHCSPAWGSLYWSSNIVHHWYKFGYLAPEKGYPDKNPATMQLIRNLFNEVTGSFSVSDNASHIGRHLYPNTIAKIIGSIKILSRFSLTKTCI